MTHEDPLCYSRVKKGGITINQLILIGRLTKDPEMRKQEGKSNCQITVAVKRPFKNPEGIYETDFIRCTVWNVIAEKVCEYCKKGDMVSVKARIQNNDYVDKDEKMVYSYEIVADQISFLQTHTSESEETTEEEENPE